MASLEDLLWETMPLQGAKTILQGTADSVPAAPTYAGGEMPPPAATALPSLLDASEIPSFTGLSILKLATGDDYAAPKPDIHPEDYRDPWATPIWSWTHAGATPNSFTAVSCRSRSSNYRNYLVMDSLEFGFEAENAKGALVNAIRITNLAGKRINLPLTKDFVACKFAVTGGAIVANQLPKLWVIEAKHDQSLVMAFIYTISADKDPAPMSAADAAAMNDDFMPSGTAAAPVGADVHGAPGAASVDPNPRILVIVSLTTCKQGLDFAPGSVIGAGRFYPHILVMSSMSLSRIEATVRMNRPENTTSDGSAGEVAPPADLGLDKYASIFTPDTKKYDGEDCCAGPIGGYFFTDTNDQDDLTSLPVALPFWSHYFSYYALDVYPTYQNRTFNMVTHDPDKCTTRNSASLVIRYLPAGRPTEVPFIRGIPAPSSRVTTALSKLAYEGEFDNIHISPKMKLFKVKKVTHYQPSSFSQEPDPVTGQITPPTYDVDKDSLHLDDITMAPFCAHDCLHLHWRWGKDATDAPQMGFDGMLPNKRAGATMVPANQTVQAWLRAPNKFTYTATVWGFPAIPAGEWQTIAHHGASYAVDATAFLLIALAKVGVDTFAGQPTFTDEDDATISCRQSWSLMYWRLRWETVMVDGKAVLRERVRILDAPAAWAL